MTTPTRETDITLPPIDDLDLILGEQEQFDKACETEPEFNLGELGRTDLERRAEIPALAKLHHDRRVIARALAPIAALCEGGQNPPIEAKRKQHRHVVATLIAGEQGIDGEKQESRLERLANADPRHVDFCKDLDTIRVKYTLGRIALMEINEAIRDREESLRAYNAEIRSGLHGAGQV
jgi:hypothetical protein